jgi:hypothetical protein
MQCGNTWFDDLLSLCYTRLSRKTFPSSNEVENCYCIALCQNPKCMSHVVERRASHICARLVLLGQKVSEQTNSRGVVLEASP